MQSLQAAYELIGFRLQLTTVCGTPLVCAVAGESLGVFLSRFQLIDNDQLENKEAEQENEEL